MEVLLHHYHTLVILESLYWGDFRVEPALGDACSGLNRFFAAFLLFKVIKKALLLSADLISSIRSPI